MSTVDWAAICEEQLGQDRSVNLPRQLNLPALPTVVTRFLEAAGQPDPSPKMLAQILETDSGLTAELLRYVNSAFHARRHRIRNVQQAITLLGPRTSKTFVMTTGAQAAMRARQSKLISQNGFWNTCLQRALFASEVAALLKTDIEVAFAGGLLQDLLLPVLSNDLYEDYLKFTGRGPEEPTRLIDFEQARFGWSHALAGGVLVNHWHLPHELACCLLYHHAGLQILAHPQLKRTPLAAVALSALLPDQLRQEPQGLAQLHKLQKVWPTFELRRLLARVDERHAEMADGVENDFPLAPRCLPTLDALDAAEAQRQSEPHVVATAEV